MYGRRYEDQELNFEASGALRDSALIMRDRETDSWWSIMTADAIGGPLQGTDLVELPVGEKTTWGDWRATHPDSLVLSVEGVEHDDSNPYERYFTSDETFRGQQVDDDRLPPKEPIYSFQLGGTAYAVPHTAIEGGAIFDLGAGRTVFLHRPPGASVFAGSGAWEIPTPKVNELGSTPELAAWLADGSGVAEAGAHPLSGFDTYWYTWAAVHPETVLLGSDGSTPGN